MPLRNKKAFFCLLGEEAIDFCLFRENELDLVFCSGDLCDCYFERQIIFLEI